MKKITKNIVILLFTLAMLVSITGMPQQTITASANKAATGPNIELGKGSLKDGGLLTEKDFDVKGKYAEKVKKQTNPKKINYKYVTIQAEKAPRKCIKTARGITLLSSRKQVTKRYGMPHYEAKGSFKKFANAELRYLTGNDKSTKKLVFNKNVDICGYDNPGENDNIYFCFRNNKVIAVYFVRHAPYES